MIGWRQMVQPGGFTRKGAAASLPPAVPREGVLQRALLERMGGDATNPVPGYGVLHAGRTGLGPCRTFAHHSGGDADFPHRPDVVAHPARGEAEGTAGEATGTDL